MKRRVLILIAFTLLSCGEEAPRSSLRDSSLKSIGIDQRIGESLPLHAQLVDSNGKSVTLKEVFSKGRPVVLTLIYNRCPMLCSQVLSGLTSALKTLELDAGKDFDVLAVSFDPEETPEVARKQKKRYLRRYGRAAAEDGFYFLTGEEDAIAEVTEAVGFRYEYDRELEEYAHASAAIVVTPDGRLARYFYGSEFSPRDMKLALVEASDGEIGDVADELLLLCYRYDPQVGAYSASVINAIRAGGVLTVAALGLFVGLSLRRERKRRRSES